MMLKHFRISSPNGGFDPYVARGYWEGDVDTCLHTSLNLSQFVVEVKASRVSPRERVNSSKPLIYLHKYIFASNWGKCIHLNSLPDSMMAGSFPVPALYHVFALLQTVIN
jgi:hypothetical protein